MASLQPDRAASSVKNPISQSKSAQGNSKPTTRKTTPHDQELLDVRTDSESPTMARKKWFRWLLGSSILGYCLSFFFHSTILTSFAFITFTEAGQTVLNTILSETDEVNNVFTDSLDTKLEVEGLENEAISQPELEITEAPVDLKLPDLSSQLNEKLIQDISQGIGNNIGDGKENGNGKGDQLLFKMPTSGKVVTKGSFTAWTDPEDPKPGQGYRIIIQIELPKRVNKYQVKDLSGLVVGTDDYVQEIPGMFQKKNLPVKDNKTQFVVWVPGAQQLVEDTITIKSELLNEKQNLKIIF